MKDCNRASAFAGRLLVKPLAWLNGEPVVFRTGRFHLVYFGIFAALATFMGISFFLFYVKAKGYSFQLSPFLLSLLVVSGKILGIKVYHVFAVGRDFFRTPWKYLNETTMYNQGGVMGVFVTLLGIAFYERIDISVIMDGAAMAAVLGLWIGRLGCYNYGCCFGVPAKSNPSVIYRNPDSKVLRMYPELRGVPLVPTQLYTAWADLFMFILFAAIAVTFPYNGLISLLFIILYNGFRATIQRYRFSGTVNELDYRRIARNYLLGGFLLVSLYGVACWETIAPDPLRIPFTPGNYCASTFSDMKLLLSLLTVSIIALVYYGIHGRTLGKHFN